MYDMYVTYIFIYFKSKITYVLCHFHQNINNFPKNMKLAPQYGNLFEAKF